MTVSRIGLWPLALVLGAVGCGEEATSPPPPPSPASPPGIVLFIGDGMGAAALEAARIRAGSLALERVPLRGEVTTANAVGGVTDSGAAATALATGVRTLNTLVGLGPDSAALETVLEAAERRGMATGLVATSSVTHATPAAFAAHVRTRDDQFEIARQMAASGVDVLLGGGQKFFSPARRPDGLDLAGSFRGRGCTYLEKAEGLASVPGGAQCLVGLFAWDGMPAVTAGRTPPLREMALAALSVLTRDPDGFFLMVEGSQIDWAAHANHGPSLTAETLDLDGAVDAVLRALGDRPNTLVIVTSDHETGGLSVSPGGAPAEVVFRWRTGTHTELPVPLRARGPGAEQLGATVGIDAVGRVMLRQLRGP